MKTIQTWLLRTAFLGIAVAGVSIALAVLASGSAQAGGACRGGELNDKATTAVVVNQYMCFEPGIVRVAPGTTVTWDNPESGIAHAVTGSNLSFGDYNELGTGASVSHTFNEPGVFPYFCYLHPGMVGTVIVEETAGDSVSLAGGAGRGDANAAQVPDDNSGFDSRWLIIPLAAVAAIAMGGAGYAVGTRRVKP